MHEFERCALRTVHEPLGHSGWHTAGFGLSFSNRLTVLGIVVQIAVQLLVHSALHYGASCSAPFGSAGGAARFSTVHPVAPRCIIGAAGCSAEHRGPPLLFVILSNTVPHSSDALSELRLMSAV